VSEETPNWVLVDQGVRCPSCSKAVAGLDWTDGGMRLYPCRDVISQSSYSFGPTGQRGALEFRRAQA